MTTRLALDFRTRSEAEIGPGVSAADGAARRVQMLTVTYVAGGAAIMALVFHDGHHIYVGRSIPWPLIAAGLVAANVLAGRLHADRRTRSLELMGTPVAVEAIFSSRQGLLAAMAIAMVVCWIPQRPWGDRAAFDVVNQMVGTSAAYLVIADVLAGGQPIHLRGVLAVAAGVLTYEVVTLLGFMLVDMAALGVLSRPYMRTVAVELSVVFPFTAIMAVVAVTIAMKGVWDILLLAGPAVVLGLWYRAARTVRSRYANLQVLFGFTVKLTGLTTTDEVISVALTETRSLLDCADAQLVLPINGGALRYQIGPDLTLRDGFGDLTALEMEVARSVRALVIKGVGDTSPTGPIDIMAMAVPLGELGSGVVRVTRPGGAAGDFDPEDVRLFEALAAHLSTSLTSSHRLDRLRSEMSIREHQALHDHLTGLPNRTMFTEWVPIALEACPDGELIGIMLMDLDGFKEVNDTLGHQVGDRLLQEIGARVTTSVGPDRLAARLGGDEFAFVVPGVRTVDEVMAVARAVMNAVALPIELDGLMLELRASMGVAIGPDHGSDAPSLLRKADVAMYSAKASAAGVVTYHPSQDQHAKRRLVMASELRGAMDASHLQVWYQPIADTATGEITGLEALTRWPSGSGFVSPDEFIPVAEQTGMIEPLTTWVLAQSLRQIKAWRAQGLASSVSVNLSVRSLQTRDIVTRLQRLFDQIGVDRSALVLEITESVLMTDTVTSTEILGELAGLGVRIALDDFGTGYSSLSRLKQLPVDTVKIDRSFVTNMDTDGGDDAIVKATIDMAQTMGLQVVAEGVENRPTWDRLKDLGCDYIQGYILAPALAPPACGAWLRARRDGDYLPKAVGA